MTSGAIRSGTAGRITAVREKSGPPRSFPTRLSYYRRNGVCNFPVAASVIPREAVPGNCSSGGRRTAHHRRKEPLRFSSPSACWARCTTQVAEMRSFRQPREGRRSIAQGAAGVPQATPPALGVNRPKCVGRVPGSPAHRRATETERTRGRLGLWHVACAVRRGVVRPRATAGLLADFALGRRFVVSVHPGQREVAAPPRAALGY